MGQNPPLKAKFTRDLPLRHPPIALTCHPFSPALSLPPLTRIKATKNQEKRQKTRLRAFVFVDLYLNFVKLHNPKTGFWISPRRAISSAKQISTVARRISLQSQALLSASRHKKPPKAPQKAPKTLLFKNFSAQKLIAEAQIWRIFKKDKQKTVLNSSVKANRTPQQSSLF